MFASPDDEAEELTALAAEKCDGFRPGGSDATYSVGDESLTYDFDALGCPQVCSAPVFAPTTSAVDHALPCRPSLVAFINLPLLHSRCSGSTFGV